MTLTLAQSSDNLSINDLTIDANGVLSVVDGKLSYADIISDVIRTLKGEILLAPDVGIDYFGTIFKSIARLNIWKFHVRSSIEALDFVTNIVSFDANYNTRTKVLTYKLTVATDLGSVEVQS